MQSKTENIRHYFKIFTPYRRKIIIVFHSISNYWMRSSKISWFVSGEQINYLPKPKAGANNWSARSILEKKKCAICADLLFCLINVLPFLSLCCCCHCCCNSSLFWRGTLSRHMDKCKMCLYISATTGYYENVPVLLRGTFYTYSISAMKL